MSITETVVTVVVPGAHLMSALLGERDVLLRRVEASFPKAVITVRGNEVRITGEDADTAGRVVEELSDVLQRGEHLDLDVVARVVAMVRNDVAARDVLTTDIVRVGQGRPVRAKTAGQKRYVDAIRDHLVTFAIGPAGTGKSWLAVAMAVQALQAKQVQRILLTRPAVEAGERLGFLPGDLMAKIDPYLRPLYDALHDMVGADNAAKYLERGVVEVAPLAFMRGRTLTNSFIILDEAQNTTPEQMKMFLTRIGFGAKVVVTGDTTQIDVPDGRSGLAGLEKVLTDIEGLVFVHLDGGDVVRHRIVADIVAAYERNTSPDTRRGSSYRRGDR
jgi:phosphate starvation-inducible PhoH-like protein